MTLPLEVTDPADPESQAARYLLDGEGAEEAGEGEVAQAPEAREFRYRGKTVKVDAETYSVLEDLRRDARGANGRLGSELAKTRERLARLEGIAATVDTRQTEPEIKPPDPLLATRDIAAWQAQYDAYHTAKMERQKAELERQYTGYVQRVESTVQRSQRDTEWANRFYSTYDHFDNQDIKPVVAQVYTEHREEIDAFGDDVEAAHERLAELAEERLVRLKRAGKTTETNNPRRPPRLESAAAPTPGKTTEEPARDFSAASWVARQRLKMTGMEPRK